MMSPAPHFTIHNVLVALDDATLGPEMMETAVNVAVALHADLQGLYVEDDSLLRLAELPFVHEITTGSATVRPIDAQSMQRAMRHRADLARRVLEKRAESARIRCSFSVTHGRAGRRSLLCTLRAETETNVIFFACRSHAPGVTPPLGLRTSPVVRPLLLLVDDAPRSVRTVAATTAVASTLESPIVLLVLAHDRDAFQRVSSATSKILCDLELAHTLLPHPITTTSALIQSTRDQRPALLLLSRESELISESTIESMVDQLDCSIVLV